jgi:hypothetical protein
MRLVLRKVFPNPENLKRLSGVTKKIKNAGWRGEELIIEFEDVDERGRAIEINAGEKQALQNLLKNGILWELVEEQ